jgi:hypothetical protein
MDTIVPCGQPEIASGLESQIELWLPSEQHTGKRLRESGARCFALAQLTKSVTGHGISYYQCRGAGCQKKIWLPGQEKIFLLTAPFIELSVNVRVGIS